MCRLKEFLCKEMIATLTALLFCSVAIAQPQITWVKQYGGVGQEDVGQVCALANGDVMLVGATTTKVKLAADKSAHSDIHLMRVSALGEKVWENQQGLHYKDYASSVAMTMDGGWVIAGAYHHEASGRGSSMVARFSASGKLLWTKHGAATEYSTNIGVAVLGSGDIITLGIMHKGSPQEYYILVRRDQNGEQKWTMPLPANSEVKLERMMLTPDQNILVAGSIFRNNQWDGLAMKLNTEFGGIMWEKKIGTPKMDRLTSVTLDTDGNAIFGGYSDVKSPGKPDAWILKMNYEDGSKVLDHYFGSSGSDYIHDLVCTPEGRLVFIGKKGTVGGAGWYGQFDRKMQLLWQETYSQNDTEYLVSCALTADGSLIVSGTTDVSGYKTQLLVFKLEGISPTMKRIFDTPKIVFTGTVTDANTGKPLAANAKLISRDKSVMQSASNSQGLLTLDLIGGQTYALQLKAEHYLMFKDSLKVEEKNITLKSLALNPIVYKSVVRMYSLRFDPNTEDLVEGSTAELDALAAMLVENPEIGIDIGVYSDNLGHPDEKQRQTEARAEMIRYYLMFKGIDEIRIRAAGYGGMKGITSNDTEENRAKNRRVEYFFFPFGEKQQLATPEEEK
jgi:outer membrane protein OmpA-like peptidoglycan-associated protein